MEELIALKSLGFKFVNTNRKKLGFLTYLQGYCYAYLNQWPHTEIGLNGLRHQLLSHDGLFLQCSMHGALFQPETGLCIHGPCSGQNFLPLDINIENAIIYIAEEHNIVTIE